MQVFIYEIIVKSSSKDGHKDHLQQSFESRKKYVLNMNPLKCVFF